MGSRLKEDERNERIIRGLLKLPENRRCINCSSLGPQYVCTNFWTFVCTTCSGIHREFTHRVKSVSMAKFTSQEVACLQEGGNQKAKDVYLKEWDSKHQSGPDGSNIERLRDFIKHVYVDRRFSGEKGQSRPPSGKMGERDDPYESRKSEGGSRSPPNDGSRREYNDFIKSPSRPEIINDWRREERFGNGPKQEERRGLDGETNSKLNSSPPPVRPVREILGDNATPLVVQPPKLPVPNGPAQIQATLPAVRKPEEKTTVEMKPEIVKSLIDFDDFEPSTGENTAVAQPPQAPLSSSVASSALDSNWASFEFPSNQQASAIPSNTSPLESALSQISLSSAPSPSVAPTAPTVNDNTSFGTNIPSSFPTNSSQYQPPAVPFGGSAHMNMGASSMGQPAASTEEIKSSGRKELPRDLFTSAYSPYHPPMPYWQPHLMGYNMQAIRMVQAPPSFQQPMSANPFDVGDLPHVPRQPQPVVPMANPQGGIPHFSQMGLQQNAAVFPAWMSASAHPQSIPHMMQPSQTAFAHASNQQMGGLSVEGSHHGVPSAQPFPSQGGNPFG